MHHNMRLYPSPGSSPEPQTGGMDVHPRGNRSKPFFRVAEHTYRFHDQEANSNKAYYLFYLFYYTNYDHGCQWLLPPRLGLTLVSCMTTCAIPTCKPANRCQAPNRGISRFFITNKDMHSKQTCKDTFLQVWGFAALWRCGGRHHQAMPFRHGCCRQPYINTNPYATWSL